MLYYCPLKDCECKYHYCPCFTGSKKDNEFGCLIVDAVKIYVEEQKIQELAKHMIANTSGVRGYFSQIAPEEEWK